jgi:hypothetical protein
MRGMMRILPEMASSSAAIHDPSILSDKIIRHPQHPARGTASFARIWQSGERLKKILGYLRLQIETEQGLLLRGEEFRRSSEVFILWTGFNGPNNSKHPSRMPN